ncbi:DNA-binding protein, 42 kDa [Trichophyton interdigitale]|nr:DNA-binding protein, 42 kDa [Trichophyton interdigitale]
MRTLSPVFVFIAFWPLYLLLLPPLSIVGFCYENAGHAGSMCKTGWLVKPSASFGPVVVAAAAAAAAAAVRVAAAMAENTEIDYTLNNPDTLTKYKTAAQISHKVLEAVSGWCVEGAKIVELCEKGDKLLDEEVAKVYKGKKVSKGISHPTTVSPSSFVTPYTPLTSDAEEAATELKANEVVKIQLGAQIDGFGTIVCDTIVVGGKVTGREADLLLATHYANELLLRLMVPPGLVAQGTEEEKKKAAAEKPPTQAKISSLLEKVAKSYDCTVVENTTSWLFERNEIEGSKKIIVAPGTGVKGEGTPEVQEVWGVEVGLSLGSGKVKTLEHRPTLHRRTTTTYILKRPSSRQTLSEIVKKFGTFPFSLRQLDDERAGKPERQTALLSRDF